MLTVTIDRLPPSINSCYVASEIRGKRFKTKEYKDWDILVKFTLNKLQNIPHFVGILSVEIELHAPDWMTKKGVRKRDCDNYSKTAVDAVFKNLKIDDSWVFEQNIKKVHGPYYKTVVRIFDLYAH